MKSHINPSGFQETSTHLNLNEQEISFPTYIREILITVNIKRSIKIGIRQAQLNNFHISILIGDIFSNVRSSTGSLDSASFNDL